MRASQQASKAAPPISVYCEWQQGGGREGAEGGEGGLEEERDRWGKRRHWMDGRGEDGGGEQGSYGDISVSRKRWRWD